MTWSIRMLLAASVLGIVLYRSLPTVEAAQKTISLGPVRAKAPPVQVVTAQPSRVQLPDGSWPSTKQRLTRKIACGRWTPSSLRAALARTPSGHFRGLSPLRCTRG